MSRVLIVGAGLTGSLCACLLRRDAQNKVHIVVWDKARGAGGRMSTSRPPDPSSHSADLGAQYITATPAYTQSHHSLYSELLSSGVLQPLNSLVEGRQQSDGSEDYITPLGMCSVVKHFLSESGGRMSTSRPPDPSSHSADLGAQYITATPAYTQSHHSLYSELLSSGVLQPLNSLVEGRQQSDGSEDYITPLGMCSVVKHFLSESGADLFFEHHVTGLYRRGASWEVQRKTGGSETFDAVVLTMPVPQILQLQGDVCPLLSVQQQQQLDAVVYSSRFAVALFFAPGVAFRFPWAARYVTDNPCIRYIAADSRKRNADAPGRGPSLVVHTSVPFGVQHLESDKDDIQPIILQELSKLLPDLPQPISIKCQKWRYSQVLTAVPDCPGHMTLLDRPLLVCGGDAFSHSNFDGCVESFTQRFMKPRVSVWSSHEYISVKESTGRTSVLQKPPEYSVRVHQARFNVTEG